MRASRVGRSQESLGCSGQSVILLRAMRAKEGEQVGGFTVRKDLEHKIKDELLLLRELMKGADLFELFCHDCQFVVIFGAFLCRLFLLETLHSFLC